MGDRYIAHIAETVKGCSFLHDAAQDREVIGVKPARPRGLVQVLQHCDMVEARRLARVAQLPAGTISAQKKLPRLAQFVAQHVKK